MEKKKGAPSVAGNKEGEDCKSSGVYRSRSLVLGKEASENFQINNCGGKKGCIRPPCNATRTHGGGGEKGF